MSSTRNPYDFGNILQSFYAGYQMPQQMEALRQQQQLNALKQQQAQQALQMQPQLDQATLDLRHAQAARQAAPMDLRFSGDVANAVNTERLAKLYGENDPRVAAARDALAQQAHQADVMAKYRGTLTDLAKYRYSPTVSKLVADRATIAQGMRPATTGGPGQSLSPGEQAQLGGQYDLAIQKGTSDVSPRNKALLAANIDKTIDQIDPQVLFQYSGIPGQAKKLYAASAAALDHASPEHQAYLSNLAASKILAHQVRQFYGDSIQPQVTAALERITNPESWQYGPETAHKQFNTLVDILRNETGTYRGALKGTSEYEARTQKTPPEIAQDVMIEMQAPDGARYSVPLKDVPTAKEKWKLREVSGG